MANFCPRCGKTLINDRCPSCDALGTPSFNFNSAKSQIETMGNHMGIYNPELNKINAYEEGMQIVPDCIKASEGEVPVKQYTIAKLRSRILGIPYAKAIGKMQVTNKRVIFRAAGKSFAGKTALQHEFAIDELAGIESRREFNFTFADLFKGFLLALLGGVLTALICSLIYEYSYNDVLGVALWYMLAIGGGIVFFALKKRWLLKLFCLGGAFASLPLMTIEWINEYAIWPAIVLGLITFALAMISLVVYDIRPNLVLIIKTKSASDAINIRRKRNNFRAVAGDTEYTGYAEVIPAEDAENCIQEINAMITDIQKLGDFGIEKWKV